MKFSDREDVEAPIDWVWRRVTDFDAHERTALRRGAEIERIDGGPAGAPGMAWRIGYEFRGRPRDTELRLVEVDAPNRMRLLSETGGIEGDVTVDLVALAPHRTRVAMAIELTPSTIPARLLVQSLRLAKAQLNRRFKDRMQSWAQDMSRRHATGGGA
ncbi:MAG: SRPBCC family protein [Hasllibacter sp.]